MPAPHPLTSIASEGLQADIDPLGAQLSALRDAEGRDLQWNGDPAVWKGRAPILFPIVGALAGGRYRLDGRVYHLPRHGFARDRLFSLVEASASHALFRLRWDDESFAVYPFRFDLDIGFALNAATLSVSASVKNLDTVTAMPASFGFHPALRWPLPYGQPRSAHAIRFETDEPAPVRHLDAEGLVMPSEYKTPIVDRTLVLRDDLFADDAIIFASIASRRLRYSAAAGPAIELAFPDTPYLGVWTKPGAGFICIEPWHGYADPQGFSGDFRAKPGIFLLAPGETKQCAMRIALRV
jgi:galactose mutarotase-like enzyme